MSRLICLPRNYTRHALVFAGLALSLYFSYHTVYGERSYARLTGLNALVAEKEKSLEEITAQRASLERDVKMMRPETLSVDLLEERARLVLGYKNPEEIVIFRN